ncbi:MAG: fused MFS/spermidine synthase [Phycisphaerales bacterium]
MRQTPVDKPVGEDSAEDGIARGRIGRQASVNLMMLIYFVSGACSLIDEVVWVRLLKLTLGNTVHATSIVVSVFMGGLALGALFMSRFSDRIRRRLRLYALLEILVTISALSLPWGLRIVDSAYTWIYRTYNPAHWQLLIVQVVLSSIILLVPSMLMGSTLPLLGRFVTALEKEAGHLVGKLYALNTLGAAAGCFLAGFVLIRALGVMGTLYMAALLNLSVAFGGWLLSQFSRTSVEEQADAAANESQQAAVAQAMDGRFYLLIVAFFASGLISIGYELLWMRSIVHLLGGYTYVFSAVLTVYLLGNVIGAGIGSGLVKQLKEPAVGFAVTLSLLGLCGILYLPLLILWTSKIMPAVDREVELFGRLVPYSTFMIKPLVQSLFLFLAPAIMMGIGFPIALQAWANHAHKVGWSTGTAYGANTIGAVTGGIVTGFVLTPLLGLQLTISILGLLGIWMAGAIYLSFVHRSRAVVRFGVLAAAGVLTLATVKVPSDLFDAVVKSNPRLKEGLELLAVKEGAVTTVSLYKDPNEGTLYLHTSGQRVAGDTYFWRSDQKMLGHFGVLLNSRAKNVLSVGFGSGESTACMVLHKLDRADCVELAPEVVDVSLRFFRHINLGDRLDDEISMIYMDAKNYVHLTDIKYDAIVNDSIHPRHFAENASLYTKEYFESAKEHLKDKGLFMTWIPTHNVEPVPILNSIMGTMMEVFPYVTIWYMTPSPALYFLVVGSDQPQYFSPRHIENELRREGVRESLSLIDINNSMDVLSCYIGDKEDLQRYVKSYHVNSDYRPFIEYSTANVPGGSAMFKRFVLDIRGESVYRHIDWTGFSEEEKNKWLSDYKQLYEASTYLLLTNGTDDYLERLKYCVEGLAILPSNPALIDVRKRTEKGLLSMCMRMIRSGRANDTLLMASNMLKIYPESVTAWMIKSSALEKMGDAQGAVDAAKTAVQLGPDSAEAHQRLGSALHSAGQFEEAITELRETLRLAEQVGESAGHNRAEMLAALAAAYATAGRLSEAAATAEKALELALSTGQKRMAEKIKRQLAVYRAGST